MNVFERHRKKVLAAFFLVVMTIVDCGVGSAILPTKPRVPHGFYHHGLEPSRHATLRWGNASVDYFTNSLGLRDGRIRQVPSRAPGRRLVVVGDSFAEGMGVPHAETVPGRLDAALNDTEVLNAGVNSYSPKLSLLKLRHLVERDGLHVDGVVLLVDLSDVQDEYLYQRFSPREIPLEVWLGYRTRKFLREHSLVMASWFAAGERGRAMHMDQGIFPDVMAGIAELGDPEFWKQRGSWPALPQQPAWVKRGMALQAQSLQAFIEYCQGRGIEPTLVVYPWPFQIAGRQASGPHVDPIRQLARARGVRLVDLYPAFINATPGEAIYARYFIAGDTHWNAAGHELVARQIAEALAKP